MNLIERAKNILVTPKTEWEVINGETATPMSLLTSYVIPLALVGSLGSILSILLFAGAGLGMTYGIAMFVVSFIVLVAVYYVSVLITDALAPSFSSEKDTGKSAQLVAYSSTAKYLSGLLSFIPILGWVIGIAAWGYGVYTMYLGLGPLKKTPEDKKVVYLLVIYAILIVIYLILSAILAAIVVATVIGSAGSLRGFRSF